MTVTRLTPLILEIFFAVHIGTDIPRPDSQGTKETLKWLQVNELIWYDTTVEPTKWIVTKKGEVWRDYILNTPLPVLQYTMPYPNHTTTQI